jgi:hypothetical protein
MTSTKTTFTAAHLNQLRASFSGIERIDPTAGTYARMVKLLDSLDRAQLQQFADAGIKFVSSLAKNRLR